METAGKITGNMDIYVWSSFSRRCCWERLTITGRHDKGKQVVTVFTSIHVLQCISFPASKLIMHYAMLCNRRIWTIDVAFVFVFYLLWPTKAVRQRKPFHWHYTCSMQSEELIYFTWIRVLTASVHPLFNICSILSREQYYFVLHCNSTNP